MTSLTFYGGAREIGGNKILLETEKGKFYLDFGQSFDFGCDYFYEYLEPRTANGLECYFEFDMMPQIPNLYSQKMLKFTGLPYHHPDVDGVFITHHHSDHTGHLGFLDESIPVYLGHGTKKLMDTYQTLYPQLMDYGEHSDIHQFKSGDRIELKDTVFRPIHVEHSTPGAYGYIIETKCGNIVFSGDFRRHGPKQEYTDEFIKEAAKAKPRWMLCEGTRMTSDPEKQYTEEQVHEKVAEVIESAKGIVFANFAMSNIDRFKSFYKAATENGRKFVVDTKMAYILDALREKIDLPDPSADENMRVYFRLARTCTFCEKDYATSERKYMENMVTTERSEKTKKTM
jgi:ribonuclease J